MEKFKIKRRSQFDEKALNLVRTAVGPKNVTVLADLPQEEKISNALGILLLSEVPQGSALDVYQQMMTRIVVAWNISLMDVSERAESLQRYRNSVRENVGDALWQEALVVIYALIAKKEEMFPRDKRVVISHDVQMHGKKIRVRAAGVYPEGDRARIV